MQLADARRVVLLNYNSDTNMIDFRHYAIGVKPIGVSKSVKKIITTEVPNLADFEDISEYVLREAIVSESDVEDGPDSTVTLGQDYVGRGNKQSEQRAIRLHEIGPRMQLTLTKVENGLCNGEVLYHHFGKKLIIDHLDKLILCSTYTLQLKNPQPKSRSLQRNDNKKRNSLLSVDPNKKRTSRESSKKRKNIAYELVVHLRRSKMMTRWSRRMIKVLLQAMRVVKKTKAMGSMISMKWRNELTIDDSPHITFHILPSTSVTICQDFLSFIHLNSLHFCDRRPQSSISRSLHVQSYSFLLIEKKQIISIYIPNVGSYIRVCILNEAKMRCWSSLVDASHCSLLFYVCLLLCG